ncbi:MAG: two-component system sensor histidine kinase CreC [Burkholderiaceae bacterium]|nr:two-component system sensor histidine kinase CreC [Burkholderiaceae bacterium]
MSIRNRILAGIVLIYLAGLAFFMYRAVSDIDPRYRESAEESLVETANLLATLLEQDLKALPPDKATAQAPVINTARLAPLFNSLAQRRFSAQIYSVHKTQVDLRAYVTDAQGRVVYDSTGQHTGEDFSRWRDVVLALRGEYGARTTPDDERDPSSMVMYVGAPVRDAGGRIAGAVTAAKPTQSFGRFVDAARRKTMVTGVVSALAVLVLGLFVSVWLVRPFGVVGDYVRHVRQHRRLDLRRAGRRAAGALNAAFGELRDALLGRSHATGYVQTLTHEIKSPLSAIRGAAELLQEPLPEADRERFIGNIVRETQRIQDIVDRLMELTQLESRRVLEQPGLVDLQPLLQDAAASAQGAGAARGVTVRLHATASVQVSGDAFLLRRAVGNLLDNALDFAPRGSEVLLSLASDGRTARIEVRDQGPGIPGYARDQIFERFYSLPRPDTGKKSTGLGLAFVREVALLHKGSAAVDSPAEGGAMATLSLPLARA